MKKALLLILGITVILQLAIPASMILKHERILRKGTTYRFKTRPIDPADPFQGRYVQLGFENDYIVTEKNAKEPHYNERVYVTLNTGSDGLCELTEWSREKPKQGDYLKLRSRGKKYDWSAENGSKELGLQFDLPFDRFYMDENKAPRAERLVPNRRFNLFDTENTNLVTNCWANVRVLNGTGLIEDVLVDGVSIREAASDTEEKE